MLVAAATTLVHRSKQAIAPFCKLGKFDLGATWKATGITVALLTVN
jgi:hypothetical protein